MGKRRLRQVTDNIHDTIYLSELESLMASSAEFYRLHDVYQSSTVYMTFPSNRTKRYEHSLGTMQIAAEMLYYAIANAEESTVKGFLRMLSAQHEKLWNSILTEHQKVELVYSVSGINKCLDRWKKQKTKNPKFQLDWSYPDDRALNHFLPILPSDTDGSSQREHFLFVCVLEAVRIAALFHDAGHPPFSHVIEHAINDLYQSTQGKRASTAMKEFTTLIGTIKKQRSNVRYITRAQRCGNKSPALHEAIGIKLLETAFTECYNKIATTETTYVHYYVTVYEFAFAILEEKSPFWASIHRIIDGPFDADRLDYILRDTRNSGVNWGGIPYKRIIESARLIKRNRNQYLVAFPQKLSEDIDDILLIRYKIFARINANHRCIKTEKLLQKSVTSIALAYLNGNSKSNDWYSGIEELWMLLDKQWQKSENCISKWNDSWLITTLQSILIEIDYKLLPKQNSISEEEKKELRCIQAALQSILLNYSNYFTLIKRGYDLNEIYQQALKKAKATPEVLNQHLKLLYEGVICESGARFGISTDNVPSEDIDSVAQALWGTSQSSLRMKISKLENWLMRIEHKEYALIFCIDQGINPWEEIREKLSAYKDTNVSVEECILARQEIKTGIASLLPDPKTGRPAMEIPLYGADDQETVYDPQCIHSIINNMMQHYSSIHYYIRFNDGCNNQKEHIRKMRQIVIEELASQFRSQYEKEFDYKLPE